MTHDPLPPVVVPAGTPGPDGQTRPYPVYADAADLLFENVVPVLPRPKPRLYRPDPAGARP